MIKMEKKTEKNLRSSEDETEDGAQLKPQTAIRTASISAVIEEGGWIEYMKRRTDEAIEQMKNTKNPMLDQNSLKNEMGDWRWRNHIATGRKMGSESS